MTDLQNLIKLLRPVIIIISVFFSFILTIICLNLFKFSLLINNIIYYVVRIFDSGVNEPLTYIKWGFITMVLYCLGLIVLFMGNYVENYSSKPKVVRRIQRINHHCHHY